MKTRFLATLGLLAILLASCAPAGTKTKAPQPASATSITTESTATPTIDLTATRAYTDSLNSATPQLVVTSRGPNLEATDPKMVSMASGGLQLVEFFEFW
jgi:hypothetical protein